jgi:hypothetical protein
MTSFFVDASVVAQYFCAPNTVVPPNDQAVTTAGLCFASLGDHIDVDDRMKPIALHGFCDLQPLFPSEVAG